MKILLFSDIHSDLAALSRLMAIDADVYFCAGDLVNWAKGLDAAGEILQQRAGKVWMIPGNHESAGAVAAFCERYGLEAMHGRSVEIAGVHIAALGYSNPTPFDTPGEYSEEELARRLEPFAGLDPLVLVCHCPPRDTALDRVREGAHFGSTAIREFIERVQPRLFFCGHIHEAHGAECELGRTRGRNLGKQGWLLDLSSV
jgi:Icc-related predicted phosphoesterase